MFQALSSPACTRATFPAQSLPSLLQAPRGVLTSGDLTPPLKPHQCFRICPQNTSAAPEQGIRSRSQARPQASFPASSPPFSTHPGAREWRKVLEPTEARAFGNRECPESFRPAALAATFWTHTVILLPVRQSSNGHLFCEGLLEVSSFTPLTPGTSNTPVTTLHTMLGAEGLASAATTASLSAPPAPGTDYRPALHICWVGMQEPRSHMKAVSVESQDTQWLPVSGLCRPAEGEDLGLFVSPPLILILGQDRAGAPEGIRKAFYKSSTRGQYHALFPN